MLYGTFFGRKEDLRMRNIIIGGSPRSGKTTLANKLKRELPHYNILHCDVLRNTLIQCFSKEKLSTMIHTEQYCEVILTFINNTIKDSEYPYIIEWSRLYPEYADRIIGEHNIIIYLNLGEMNEKKYLEMCRKYDTYTDFTFQIADEYLLNSSKRWCEINKRILNINSEDNMNFNTYEEREIMLEKISSKVKYLLKMKNY